MTPSLISSTTAVRQADFSPHSSLGYSQQAPIRPVTSPLQPSTRPAATPGQPYYQQPPIPTSGNAFPSFSPGSSHFTQPPTAAPYFQQPTLGSPYYQQPPPGSPYYQQPSTFTTGTSYPPMPSSSPYHSASTIGAPGSSYFPSPMPAVPFQQGPTPTFSPPKITVSQHMGKIHSDTLSFNDFEALIKPRGGMARVAEIRCIYDKKSVFGIQVYYEFPNGERITGGMHMGNHLQKGIEERVLVLSRGETITEVSGRVGDWIHNLKIVTSDGKVLECGGSGGWKKSITIPMWQKVIGFAGGTAGHQIGRAHV